MTQEEAVVSPTIRIVRHEGIDLDPADRGHLPIVDALPPADQPYLGHLLVVKAATQKGSDGLYICLRYGDAYRWVPLA